jgi:hypothetical protein
VTFRPRSFSMHSPKNKDAPKLLCGIPLRKNCNLTHSYCTTHFHVPSCPQSVFSGWDFCFKPRSNQGPYVIPILSLLWVGERFLILKPFISLDKQSESYNECAHNLHQNSSMNTWSDSPFLSLPASSSHVSHQQTHGSVLSSVAIT